MSRRRKGERAEPGSEALPRRDARAWLLRHRTELLLFVGAFLVLACFSGQRFLRQSAAPHFIYQARAWLDGRLDVDPAVLPNLEDWACVRPPNVRCQGRSAQPGDRWYVSFPPVPAVVMLPFVALHGYQFNDTSFTVALAALALVLAYRFLRTLVPSPDAAGLALVLGFGTLFFSCAIRGEVWFTAEILGTVFTFLYLNASVRARAPLQAGVWYALATLTRTPLVFSLVFFLLEWLTPGGEQSRRQQLEEVKQHPRAHLRTLMRFVLGALPLAIAAAALNQVRFGHLGEFGHAFLFNNRVNADIDQHGLFNFIYLPRNLESAFLMLPRIRWNPPVLDYDPNGLSLLLTLPWLVLLFLPRQKHRLQLPLWVTVAACALPGLLYQNNGYMQFGFRFSLDYTPYLLTLLAVSGWGFRRWPLRAAVALGVLVNFWGALAFHGYTEYVRHWP